jgi:hypothetical protein
MDGLILLAEAREAGLAVAAESGKLVIRGPKRAEPVALRLIGHKVDVIRALADATGWPARHREAFAYWRALHPEHEATHLAARGTRAAGSVRRVSPAARQCGTAPPWRRQPGASRQPQLRDPSWRAMAPCRYSGAGRDGAAAASRGRHAMTTALRDRLTGMRAEFVA